ncbi:biopolymer transporter ExbD [Ruficoccus sp. ZRK36]|uniref:ExbD/TolR family protein n=1 Tax=Ruficoccus sp. ZRK36 TaxID=2866311 RepID=UPI001C72FF35|nr:biopolymer transporter ExbD [Ruficoccus sp. ZRK36]QYY37310.1 biopolymer transporter ExbD [Ruficoccus sp. ZRK36]
MMPGLLHENRRLAGVHPTLVDLAFVLVFLFLILSSLANVHPQSAGREASLPPMELPELDAPVQQGQGISEQLEIVTLGADGSLLLGKEPVSGMDALLNRLSSESTASVELRAAAAVPYGELARLLEKLYQHGIREVSLSYQPRS